MYSMDFMSGGCCMGFPITGVSKSTKRKLNKLKNVLTFQNVFASMVSDAINSRYDIEGVPETISKRYLKLSLLWYPGCVFKRLKNGGVIAMSAAPSGEFNAQSDPGKVFAYSYNGYAEEMKVVIPGGADSSFLRKNGFGGYMEDGSDAVFVRENFLMFPFVRYCIQYAEAVADTYRTLDTCRANLKRPYIVVCEESVKSTVEKYFSERDENADFIISSGIFSADKIQILPIVTNTDSLNCCVSMLEWYNSQFKIKCGISANSNIDKKGENINSAEITVDDMYTDLQGRSVIDCLNEGFDIVNSTLGTHMRAVEPKLKSKNSEEDVKDDEDLGQSEKSDLSGDKGSDA